MTDKLIRSIAGRLSLRAPQRQALEVLGKVMEIARPQKGQDLAEALAVITGEYPTVTNFERDFVSLCFALATGVGKTRLMGAFISYLHLACGINNFFVLAPNLTIYKKLVTDFTPNTPKYVFTGIAEFAVSPPAIVTSDNYEQRDPASLSALSGVTINVFNISKINSEVRGGKSPRIKRLSEYIGQSYFEYLSTLTDLVLLMDESHRYRSTAGVNAINELRPILGLELTATPFAGTTLRNRQYFRNVVLDYPLRRAMADGFVKEPVVVTRKDFRADDMDEDEIDNIKLEDGARLHEATKIELELYSRETGKPFIKPFMLVVAQDTAHANELMAHIQSEGFFGGRYRGKVIQVDSKTKEEEFVERLLKVEQADEPTEIVIHVNMLAEGWDVTNLYTIVPLRAAAAPRLIEQTIGRGLRLPYGTRTGVEVLDSLSIIAHDKFQQVIDEANRPESAFRLRSLVLDASSGVASPTVIVSRPVVDATLDATGSDFERRVGRLARDTAIRMAADSATMTGLGALQSSEVRQRITEQVRRDLVLPAGQEEVSEDIETIVDVTMGRMSQGMISIPRIVVVPRGEARVGFGDFELSLEGFRYAPIADDLWSQSLRTGVGQMLVLTKSEDGPGMSAEDVIVAALDEHDDLSYDDHAELMYRLAACVVEHLSRTLEPVQVQRVVRLHSRDIASRIHAQMQDHVREDAEGYDTVVTRGFVPLLESAFRQYEDESIRDFRDPVPDLGRISQYLFGGFARCLYAEQKFHSNPERMMAIILDRESLRWFRPATNQFDIRYRAGGVSGAYQPDFVAETEDAIVMIEVKAADELDDPVVLAKAAAARAWCARASEFTQSNGDKSWMYWLISDAEIAENMTLVGLAQRAS